MARRPTQIEALRKTMQEGCSTIIEAVVEKKMAYDIEEWMRGLVGASDGQPK